MSELTGFTTLLPMTRTCLLFGILALSLANPVAADTVFHQRLAPGETEGTADFIRVISPGLAANAVVIGLRTSNQTLLKSR